MAMILRWVCEKCNKRWIYPVEKCVYCKGPIVKQIGKQIKVTGITKVNIPSPMHPIIPYNIVLLHNFTLDEKDKILVKQSCITAAYPYQAVNTSPEFLDAVLKVLYDFGI